jgi:hypothetical protein
MRAHRALLIASGTLAATAIGLLHAVPAWPGGARESRVHPRGVVENCATQSGADFAGGYTSPHNLVVGPLSLVGAGGMPEFVWDPTAQVGFQKFMVLVRQKHRVTIELTRRTRRGAGLAYGPLPQGETYLSDTHRVVTFIACRTGSVSSADGRPVTFWSGSVLARSPRCVPLRIWIDKRRTPRRAVIRLGVSTCG